MRAPAGPPGRALVARAAGSCLYRLGSCIFRHVCGVTPLSHILATCDRAPLALMVDRVSPLTLAALDIGLMRAASF